MGFSYVTTFLKADSVPRLPRLPCTHKFKCSEPTALIGFVVTIRMYGINSIPTI